MDSFLGGRSGNEYKKVCIDAKGDPTKRLSIEEVMHKYMDCLDFAGTFSRKTAEKAAKMTLTLDTIQDVSELINIFTFPDKL